MEEQTKKNQESLNYICIEFISSPHSYFQNSQINTQLIHVLVPLHGLKYNYKITPKTFQISNIEESTPFTLIYDFSSFELKKSEILLNSSINLEPKIHQKTIISLCDSILFCHPHTYIKLLQELTIEDELILDSILLLRIESILSYLKII